MKTIPCPECKGTGRVDGDEDRQWICSECDGTGTVEVEDDEGVLQT